MTLDEICQNVRTLSTRRGWDQSDPLQRVLFVSSEVGEISDALIKLQGALAAGSPNQVDRAKHDVGHEIFDTIWNLRALANTLEIDITAAAREKVSFNDTRDW